MLGGYFEMLESGEQHKLEESGCWGSTEVENGLAVGLFSVGVGLFSQ